MSQCLPTQNMLGIRCAWRIQFARKGPAPMLFLLNIHVFMSPHVLLHFLPSFFQHLAFCIFNSLVKLLKIWTIWGEETNANLKAFQLIEGKDSRIANNITLHEYALSVTFMTWHSVDSLLTAPSHTSFPIDRLSAVCIPSA